MPYNSKRPPPLLIHLYPRRRMNKESDKEVEDLIQDLSIANTDTKAAQLNAIEEHVAQFNYLYAYPPFRRILYEVLFELNNNRPPLLCTFSRAYIQYELRFLYWKYIHHFQGRRPIQRVFERF